MSFTTIDSLLSLIGVEVTTSTFSWAVVCTFWTEAIICSTALLVKVLFSNLPLSAFEHDLDIILTAQIGYRDQKDLPLQNLNIISIFRPYFHPELVPSVPNSVQYSQKIRKLVVCDQCLQFLK